MPTDAPRSAASHAVDDAHAAYATARIALRLYAASLVLSALYRIPRLTRAYHAYRDARSGDSAEFWTHAAQAIGARLLVFVVAAGWFLADGQRLARWLSRPIAAAPGDAIARHAATIVRLWGCFQIEYAVLSSVTAIEDARAQAPAAALWRWIAIAPFDWAIVVVSAGAGIALLTRTAACVRLFARRLDARPA